MQRIIYNSKLENNSKVLPFFLQSHHFDSSSSPDNLRKRTISFYLQEPQEIRQLEIIFLEAFGHHLTRLRQMFQRLKGSLNEIFIRKIITEIIEINIWQPCVNFHPISISAVKLWALFSPHLENFWSNFSVHIIGLLQN